MAWTDPPTQTNGVNDITKSELNTYLRDNLEALRDRPSVKVDTGSSSFASGVAGAMPLNTSPVEEWDTDGVRSSFWFDLRETQQRTWYLGCTAKIGNNDTDGDRRLRIYDSVSGTANAIQAENRVPAPGQVARVTTSTAFQPSSLNPDALFQGFQDSGSSIDMFATAWAQYIGDEDSSTTNPFRNALTLGQTTGATVWWNNVVRDCARRLRHRPAAKVGRANALTLVDATWTTMPFDTERYDNFGAVGTDESKIVIPTDYGGYYYFHACLRMDQPLAAGSRIRARFEVNGVASRWQATTTEATSGDAAVTVEAILDLDAGDEVTLQVRQDSGVNEAIHVGFTNHMGCFLLSCSDQTVSDRQWFSDGVLPPLIDFTEMSGSYMYPGTLNVYARDLMLHLWHPPVVGAQAEAEEETIGAGAWADVGCGLDLMNAWGSSQMPSSTWLTSRGLSLPHDGVWLVVAQCNIDAQGVGDQGNRGVKIRHNGFHESPVRTASMNVASHDWQRTTSALINGRAGDEVWLQALQNRADGDDLTIENAAVAAAWIRPYIP